MSRNDSTRSGGISFFGALALLFIALKLMGYISWSWFWVLSPLWGGLALFLAVLVVVILLGIVND